ncbi:ADP-ribosyltransferase [Nocardia suismassiliense]|uniref:ADP-ribosyltransferase n=1 Tax=Nocardia suismassiliense TaxID=2077092 RepID=UPI000D1D5FBE|nr:ADP-ribosyltransferase [Nocardia suismassiliense]
MTGTVLDVDTTVYYDTAAKVAAGASAWWAAVDARWAELEKATDMAGSYADAREWAASYDRRATEILKMVEKVATAAHSYAIVLNEMGYQRALDEHGATIDAGPAPVKPPKPMYPVLSCRIPLPSAGGPGQGLVDEGLGLVEKIGLTIPDGNATTISNAGLTWDSARTSEGAAAFPGILEAGAVAFQDIIAPEAAFIDEDLRALKVAAEQVLTAMGDLAQSCRDHRAALDELRDQLKQQLEMVRDALIQELAITAAISVASSFITFGAGAAIGLAGAAAICARYARPMRTLIENWQKARNIRAGVKFDQDLARHSQELDRISALKPKPDPPTLPKKDPIELPPTRHPPGTAKVDLSPTEQAALNRYVSDGSIINKAIREGRELTVDEKAWLDNVNSALDKMPPYEGMVTRRVELTPDEIARYKEGGNITEQPFTSSSALPDAAKSEATRNVEFQIMSQNGKYIGHNGGLPDELEVLFKSPTRFEVISNQTIDGRTVIVMGEKI